jgi:peptide/nickel transport system substrate-binding protein
MSLRLRNTRPKKISLIGRFVGAIENTKPSDRLVLRVLFFSLVASLLLAGITLSNKYMAETPALGGAMVEGIVGSPRFVNPLLAVTQADQDMTALIYSGLMKINGEGLLVPDLAESVTLSDDGRTYNIMLRKNIRFHDGTPFSARDVVFTVGLIQDADLRSPLRGRWTGVTIDEINEYELNINLEEAYTPFIENFTLGILPRHIWSDLPIEQITLSDSNTEPIGTGPFFIHNVIRDENNVITSYNLRSFTENTTVKLAEIDVRFFSNEDELLSAFREGEITSSASVSVERVAELADLGYTVTTEPIPRIFAVFFNQNRSPALRDTAVRLALATATPRADIVKDALLGYGVPMTGPVPDFTGTVESIGQTSADLATTSTAVTEAITILSKGGWVKNNTGVWEKRINGEVKKLSLTLRTANTPVYEKTIEIIARSWRELGVEVEVEQFEESDLLQAVIRPRDFEALVYGYEMNRAVDLYPFWHSSQREDPGLNIAQYANIEVDRLLGNARIATSTEARDAAVTAAANIMNREVPAIFLYVPNMMYITDPELTIAPISDISKRSERFMSVATWHMNIDRLWPLFR